jgi:hypothetical protein
MMVMIVLAAAAVDVVQYQFSVNPQDQGRETII